MTYRSRRAAHVAPRAPIVNALPIVASAAMIETASDGRTAGGEVAMAWFTCVPLASRWSSPVPTGQAHDGCRAAAGHVPKGACAA